MSGQRQSAGIGTETAELDVGVVSSWAAVGAVQVSYERSKARSFRGRWEGLGREKTVDNDLETRRGSKVVARRQIRHLPGGVCMAVCGLLVAILSEVQHESGSGIMVVAIGWNPDMAVPPTPTPIKSGWWRRGRAQNGDDGSSSPGFRAPTSQDSSDERDGDEGNRGDTGDGGGAPHTPMRYTGAPSRDTQYGTPGDSSGDQPMQGESPASDCRDFGEGQDVARGPRAGEHFNLRTPSPSGERILREVRTVRQLPFTPSSIPAGQYGSDYASRPPLTGEAGGIRVGGCAAIVGDSGVGGGNSGTGASMSPMRGEISGKGEWGVGVGYGGRGWQEQGVPRVVSWERSKDSSLGHHRAESPQRRHAQQESFRARSLSRERDITHSVSSSLASTPVRDVSAARGYRERRDSSPARILSKAGRYDVCVCVWGCGCVGDFFASESGKPQRTPFQIARPHHSFDTL